MMVLDEILDYRSERTTVQEILNGIPEGNLFGRGSLKVRLEIIDRKLNKAMSTGSFELLDALAVECATANWNGHGSVPVSSATIDTARNVLASLNSDEQPTDINADPDGEISFDWRLGHVLLAVSLSEEGRLSFIYRNGDEQRRDTLHLEDGQLPSTLRALIPSRAPLPDRPQ